MVPFASIDKLSEDTSSS